MKKQPKVALFEPTTRVVSVPVASLFAQRLIEAREHTGLTQAKLAAKAGVSTQVIQKWESGKSVPTIQTLIRWCRAADVTPNDILGF